MLTNLVISNKQAEELGASLIGGMIRELNESPTGFLSEEGISKLVQNILFGATEGIDEYADNSPFVGLGNKTANLLSPEFNAGYKTFLTKINISKKVASLLSEVKKGLTAELDEFAETTTLKIRESVYKETELLQEHIQKLSNKTFREVTLAALPWIALTTAVLVGVPLTVLYIYHRAKRNMDREKVECPAMKKRSIDPKQYRISPYLHTL